MPPSDSTTTAVATFGSCHSTKPSIGHVSTSRPSMIVATSGVPQLMQKCRSDTPPRLDRFGSPRLGVLLGAWALHVRHAHLVAAALLGRVQRLVGAVDQRGEQRRLVRGGDTDADRELQSTGKRRRGNLGAN